MKKQTLIAPFRVTALLCLLLLLCCSKVMAATTVPVTGDTAVCAGDTVSYSVLPTPGLSYQWSGGHYGYVHRLGTASATIAWGSAATGTVSVYGINSAGDTIEAGSLNVHIYAQPRTYLTASFLVGCQQLATKDTTAQPMPPGILTGTSGCVQTCEHSTVTYYAHDAAGSAYAWSVSGAVSFTPMGDSCIVSWGAPGTGAVEVTTTNIHGCKSSLSICIKVIEGPDAIFTTLFDSTYNTNSTSNTLNICAGGTVQFIDISESSVLSPLVSSYWDFGDGSFRTTSGPTTFSHKYTTAGTYTARLVVRNSCSCTDTATITIVVGACMGVDISCPSVVCEGATAVYRMTPVISCMPYLWTVKGGTILSTPPYTNNINVRWDKVDESGFGYVTFNGAGCVPPLTGKTVVRVPVIKSVGKIQGAKVICTNSQWIYNMPEWPTTAFTWTIVSGGTGSFLSYTGQRNEAVINTGNLPGLIILKVTYKNTLTGCGGYAMDTIRVESPSVINGKFKFCLDETGNWNLGGTAADWQLVYPDGTVMSAGSIPAFSAVLDQVGTYTLSVSGMVCVPDPVRFSIAPKPDRPAMIIAAADSPCANVPYKFIAGGIAAGSTFGWSVSSGKVSPAIGDSTTITFSGPGPYTVKCWRISGVAPYCTSDTFYALYAKPNPFPILTGETLVCGSSKHTYEVSYKGGEVYDYEVIPATAGSVSSGGTSPVITWNNTTSGVVFATLRVRVRKCAASFSYDLPVEIHGTPAISLVPAMDTVCSGAAVSLTIVPSSPISTVGSVKWDFGDGTVYTTTSLTETHVYYNPGGSKTNLTPTVTLEDVNGCIGSYVIASSSIWIRPLSVANATPYGPIKHCIAPWADTLYASVSSGAPATTLFTWYKGGTVMSSGPTASSLELTDLVGGLGTYYCVVTNASGCTDTTNYVTINDDCGGTGGCAGRSVAFTSSVIGCGRVQVNAIVSGGPITGFEWEADPGAYDLDETAAYIRASYPKSGLYRFKYRVSFMSGSGICTIEFDTSVVVPYVADMNYSVTCAGGSYTVTVFDHSNYFPGSAPTTYTYSVQRGVSLPVTGSGGPSFTVSGLAPGISGSPAPVYLAHTINGAYGPCTVYDTVYLPALPVVNVYDHGYNPACEKVGVIRLEAGVLSGTGPARISWAFPDGSVNDMNPVDKTLALPPGTYNVVITATNEFGCASTRNYAVTVAADLLGGTVTHAPMYPCKGAAVTLSFSPSGTAPVSYTWYEQTRFLATGSLPTWSVREDGGYWAAVKDVYGCSFASLVDSVHFVKGPDAKISGKQDQCINIPFTLDGGAPPDVIGGVYHEWVRDGMLISSFGNSVTENFPYPGTHTYKLITIVPNPGGGFCRDTTDDFIVTVHGALYPPSVSYTILDCNDYEVRLSASSPFAGTFNWSNGATGATAYTYSGGPYRVYLTDIYGCPSYSDVYVPKSPKEFLWVFPSGCYQLCAEAMPIQLLGPSASFGYYEWIRNGVPMVSGSGYVPNYSVVSPGTYNLALGNGTCTNTSDPMDVSLIPCPPSCGNDVIFDYMGQVHLVSPLCRDSLLIMLRDMGAPPPGRSYTLTAKHGIIVPGSGTLPMGPGPASRFRYIADPGFSGMTDTLILRVVNRDGSICILTRIINFSAIPCANALAKMTEDGREVTVVSSGSGKLLLAPNPARDEVRVDYLFTAQSGQRFVEVYDMNGRRMVRRELQDAEGSIRLQLDGFSAGMYQVVLLQDQEIFLHGKLIVVH